MMNCSEQGRADETMVDDVTLSHFEQVLYVVDGCCDGLIILDAFISLRRVRIPARSGQICHSVPRVG